MNKKYYWLIGAGCLVVVLFLVVVLVLALTLPSLRSGQTVLVPSATAELASPTEIPATQEVPATAEPSISQATTSESLTALYQAVNPGVVNIQVFVSRGDMVGQGAGSGFVIDDRGYIVTNNHVVADATRVTVVFYDGTEEEAEVMGTDPYSDLAVLRVETLPDGVHSLPLGDSDQVQVGEQVIAIGNPFALSSSMTSGIVSAVGRTIASGTTSFSIPQAIQTDAAINPGNSGGPLLNMSGEVIGVNAQIATNGSDSNAGVGFAIPSNIVSRVAPVLMDRGTFQWSWLGISGTSVNLLIAQANELDGQRGAYVATVTPGSPADHAGLIGSVQTRTIEGLEVPVGGDIIVKADGEDVVDFSDLLIRVSHKDPGDTMVLTVVRDGQQIDVTVQLETRPANLSQ